MSSMSISDMNEAGPSSQTDVPISSTCRNSDDKKNPKTSAERARKYRARKRFLKQLSAHELLKHAKRAKTSTERSRECRMRKRVEKEGRAQLNRLTSVETASMDNSHFPEQNDIESSAAVRQIPKTPAERAREYRARKKRLPSAIATQPILDTPPVTSSSAITAEDDSQQLSVTSRINNPSPVLNTTILNSNGQKVDGNTKQVVLMSPVQVCRTCLGIIEEHSNYVALESSSVQSTEIKSKLEACVPEMTIYTVKSPVICNDCVRDLDASYKFKRKCITTEEDIYKYLFNSEVDEVDLHLFVKESSRVKSVAVLQANIKEEANCDISKDNNEDNGSILCNRIKEETIDNDFEVTDSLFLFDECKKLSTFENVMSIVSECREASAEEVKADATPKVQDGVHLSPRPVKTASTKRKKKGLRLSSKKYDKKKKRRNLLLLQNKLSNVGVTKKKASTDVCKVCLPYSPTAVEPMQITNRMKKDPSEKNFQCGLCGMYSTIRLGVHMRMHTGEKPNECSVCGFCPAYAHHLQTHMQIHKRVALRRCSYCNFNANSELKLKLHMRRHPGCAMYKCSSCDYSSNVLKDVNTHSLVHEGKIIYECANCDFKSCLKNSLSSHVKTHSKEKLFTCMQCSFSTFRLELFNDHLKDHIADV